MGTEVPYLPPWGKFDVNRRKKGQKGTEVPVPLLTKRIKNVVYCYTVHDEQNISKAHLECLQRRGER